MPPATRRRQQQLHAAGGKPPRGSGGGGGAQQRAPTTRDYLRLAALQHGGLVFAASGIALLCAGYDAGWMHNTHLCLLSLLLCLMGLFMHETRPVKADEEYREAVRGMYAPSGGGDSGGGGGDSGGGNSAHED